MYDFSKLTERFQLNLSIFQSAFFDNFDNFRFKKSGTIIVNKPTCNQVTRERNCLLSTYLVGLKEAAVLSLSTVASLVGLT